MLVPTRNAILEAVAAASDVGVDFAKLRIASASFLDEGIASLALTWSLDDIRTRLRVVNITAPDRRLLNERLASRSRQRTTTNAAGVSPVGARYP